MAGFVVAATPTSNPVTMLIGPNGGVGQDIVRGVDLSSIEIEETGNHEQATCSFSFLDGTQRGIDYTPFRYAALRGEWRLIVQHGSETTFRGFIRQPRTEYEAVYGNKAVTAYDIGSLMDTCIVKTKFTRPAGESDKTRLQYIFDLIGGPIVAEGFTDWSKVQVLNSNMDAQPFPVRLTLRQCVERVLGRASDTGNYFMDYRPRLHTFDNDNAESGNDAPYDVNVKALPTAGTEIAPQDLSIEWDSAKLINFYVVRPIGLSFSDPESIALYGLREAYLDAPDADTSARAQRVARAALRDTREPVPRGHFSVSGTSVLNGTTRWQGGQKLYATSAVNGIDKTVDSSAGGNGRPASWQALQPFRIVRVTTRYLNGLGDRMQDIEFGGRRQHLYSAGG